MRIAVAGGTGVVGRHVVDVARERGHDVVVLSRSAGVDLTGGDGLAAALADVEAVVDVTSVVTQSADVSREFFGAVTRHLLTAEAQVGVAHHIALSIVGVDAAPAGYYAGKVLQEELVTAGPVPWTILRATQFHEFAEQLFDRMARGPVVLVPVMRSRPVAAREVGERLVALVEAGPTGRAPDLGGPQELRMRAMVRAYARRLGDRRPVVAVPLPGVMGRGMRDGSMLTGPGAELGSGTFEEWVGSVDPSGR